MALISCKGLSFAYGGETVLRGVSFGVNAGDYLCVVGENGSGKSTLMKGLLGLKEPESGSIEYGDGLRRSEIGYLPQQTALQKDFPASVFEVVLSGRLNHLGRRPFFSREDRRAAQKNMVRLGIDALAKRSYRDLSGGQQQRLMIARLLLRRVSLILLDEATSALDVDMEEQVAEELMHLDEDITVVVVSHRFSAIRGCGKVIVINGGEIEAVGSHEEMRAKSVTYRRLFGKEGAACDLAVGSFSAELSPLPGNPGG